MHSEYFDGTTWDRAAVASRQRERAQAWTDRLGWELSGRFLLTEPLDIGFVEGFESGFNATLPIEYRSFLLQVGNGGHGPGQAMRQLGAPFDEDPDWEPGEIWIRPDEPNMHLGSPFPHTHSYDAHPGEATPEDLAGGLLLFDYGCASWSLLVVSGPLAGEMWLDERVDSKGLHPIRSEAGERIGFAEYYCKWLQAPIP